MKLLLVEDSERLRRSLCQGLIGAGFVVDDAGDGVTALGFLDGFEYDLVVLDLMLPRLDGLGVLRALAERRQRPRVLVLSARDQVADRIQALDAGADDYLIKPFSFDELVARLHALARRPQQAQSPQLQLGTLVVDPRAHTAEVNGEPLPLTPRELATLTLLLRHRGRVFSRADILERTAGSDTGASDRSVEVLIFGLRRKLAGVGLDELVQTRRGAGYLIP
ncbi:response regulator transcription factor [Oleiagrimonas sp. C23AA]|uniref:response regulator transcription factor n=1 Tax=Oleiagrimonas sp. C23AA TaxID=2719047 RepID=UPI00142470B8|nr:response regulator transcription factor [Oleiagrimonas sp. C23AA]NII10094.1 response regulator transcription factor [Oleiagrimonas sp. C23AA]